MPRWLLLWSLILLPPMAAAVPQHRLEVVLDPANHLIEGSDRLRLPGPVSFLLHEGLEVAVEGGVLERGGRVEGAVPLRRWRLRPHGEGVVLRWRGMIHHPVAVHGDRLRGQAATPGTLQPEGVFLDGGSGWYPLIEGWERFTFTLRVSAPEDWWVISQGRGSGRPGALRWRVQAPQEQVVLVGGPLHRHQARGPAGVGLAVYLRGDDPELAARYLQAAGDHLRRYQALLGRYPYPKFAVVENFWETGYGFPSFTLLGPRVMRLPFILHTSLPHEVLHNWWGNGVYVDWAGGNWAEGLTAYLSDHLLKEAAGRGAEYRRATLQKYRAYAAHERDFPLRAFRARHSGASEAVGYGKALMVFHMLRLRVGDGAFVSALREFYRDHRFREAGWGDLQTAFETASSQDLTAFFRQWLDRAGAPRLQAHSPTWDGEQLRLVIEQRQEGAPYRLRLPLAVTVVGREAAWETWVELEGRRQEVVLRPPGRPLRVDVDPRFDVFRLLDDSETPPSLGQFFGAIQRLLVLPAAADAERLAAYRELARRWQEPGVDQAVVLDRELERLPDDRPVWLLGRDNRFVVELEAGLPRVGASWDGAGVLVDGRRIAGPAQCLVLAAPGPRASAPRLFADCPSSSAWPMLARKLPHYGRYGLLAFEAETGINRYKGEWRLQRTAMTLLLPGGEGVSPAPLTPRPALVGQ